MNLHWIQHVPFEGLGAIEDWLGARGITTGCTRRWAGDPLPEQHELDGIIVMGGPMGVNQTKEYPWLSGEIAWIGEHLARRTPMLGVCLGAQMMARALGSRVFAADQREVGWHDTQGLEDAHFPLPPRFAAYHWHGDTFELPPGSRRLASTTSCINQAFALGDHALALQFHLEMTRESAQALGHHCPEDLAQGPRVQPLAEQLTDRSLFDSAHGILGPLLERLFARS